MRDALQADEDEARLWASLCHFAGLCIFIIPVFGHVIGPAFVWFLKGKRHPFVDEQGKEALNFQVSITMYYMASVLLIPILVGWALAPIVLIFQVIFVIVAGVKARDGISYRYPLTIRLID